jgi:hypothetical protein
MEVTNWAPTPRGKCFGHLLRTAQLRLNFAAPLIGLADRLPSADSAGPRAWPRAQPPPPRIRASAPPAAPQRAISKSPSICAAPHAAIGNRNLRLAEPLSVVIDDWLNHFGFWFRTRACGSGCRSLAKQLTRRSDTHKAAVLRQILDRRPDMSPALSIEASWTGREAQSACVRLLSDKRHSIGRDECLWWVELSHCQPA